jgi:hypothetical protein
MITQERLKFLLNYDPDTGVFTRTCATPRTRKFKDVPVGFVEGRGYMRATIDGRWYSLHRMAWLYVYGEMPDVIDHINGDRSDNRICNLRNVDHKGNMSNQRKPHGDNLTKRLGVTWDAHAGKYRANINHNKIRYHLGCFDDPDEAHEAYLEAKRKLHETCTI